MGNFCQAYFERAVQQIVRVLYGGNAGQAQLIRELKHPHDAPGRFIGETDGANLPSIDQLFQSGKRLFQRGGVFLLRVGVAEFAKKVGVTIRPVQLVQIDIVRLQALKAGVDSLVEMVAAHLRAAANVF